LIGTQVSRAFAEFNGNVIVADIDEDKFKKLAGKIGCKQGIFLFERLDVSDPRKIKRGIERILKRFGHIDVWINMAYPRTRDWGNYIKDVTFESWDENIRVHLGGYFWTSKLILEHMQKRGCGSLINFGSIYGMVGPNFSVYGNTGMTLPVAYSAIKGGIITLSKYLATLYGPSGVRVNCICPGGVFDNQAKAFVKRYGNITPLKRMARPEEIAMPTLFLASDGASYITGHTLLVDGGWTAW
jgi:NAD(P)-dependent dehydrogenase (short-subunit alcohol dehydrogenase family)